MFDDYEDLKKLSLQSLEQGLLNCLSESANLRRHMAECKDQYSHMRSKLAQFKHLIAEKRTLHFPAAPLSADCALQEIPVKQAAKKKKTA